LIEEALEDLLKNPLRIPLNKEETKFLMCNWVSSAVYDAGQVSFMIDKRLRPILLQVKEKYLKYRLENILRLKSSYVIRFYEFLKDVFEKNTRHRKKAEKIFSLKEIREKLEIPRSYRFNDIKRFILEKARAELAEHTDIIFNYEEIKTGRKVTHIKFIIEPNPAKLENQKEENSYHFLQSKRRFIAYLRKNYVNKPILEAPNKNVGGVSKWSISEKGLVYDMYANEENINASRSDEIYDGLYEYAKENQEFAEKLARVD